MDKNQVDRTLINTPYVRKKKKQFFMPNKQQTRVYHGENQKTQFIICEKQQALIYSYLVKLLTIVVAIFK